MKLYLAAVGSDLWDAMEAAHDENDTPTILFSFFDIEMAGFQFRRRSWENLTGEPYNRSTPLE
jgi:hypothetical protein